MLVDKFGRHVYYLRISVTDRCNFNCVYCLPPQQQTDVDLHHLLRIIKVFVQLGFSKLRISGGEPFLHKNLLDFISELKKLNLEIGITTNASIINNDILEKIIQLGIKRFNISLDTINPSKFEFITKSKMFDHVINSIKVLSSTGLTLKLNCVVLKDINSEISDIIDLIEFAYQHNAIIRFIEYMPIGNINTNLFYPVTDIIQQLNKKNVLKKLSNIKGYGPGNYYIYNGRTIGFITPISTPFCSSCNRLRLTSKLKIRSCLGYNHEIDLRNCKTDNEIKTKIYEAVNSKPHKYSFDTTIKDCMRTVGG